MNTNIPLMQVHLDFHTSELIQGVGAEFNEEDFKNNVTALNLTAFEIFKVNQLRIEAHKPIFIV